MSTCGNDAGNRCGVIINQYIRDVWNSMEIRIAEKISQGNPKVHRSIMRTAADFGAEKALSMDSEAIIDVIRLRTSWTRGGAVARPIARWVYRPASDPDTSSANADEGNRERSRTGFFCSVRSSRALAIAGKSSRRPAQIFI